ncbi:MAG: hypothetical protein M3384_20180 [Acidobacteriota bacterium]|nr:hypothetical protein [Acidobacteriota bacterium]
MSHNVEKIPENDALLRVERLEFGKFCFSKDGPVVSDNGTVIEYSLLGKSRHFPPELISHCQPKTLDIEAENEDEVSNNFPYGTVLRPFVATQNSEPQPVFYRVRRRFEKGENAGTGRRYKLGRYLTVKENEPNGNKQASENKAADQNEKIKKTEEINPLMFLKAMKGAPFGGIRLDESDQIYGFQLEIEEEAKEFPIMDNSFPDGYKLISIKLPEPVENDLTAAFVKKAVPFILSGIPVDISENISEEDFFLCVFAVWSAVPPPLRRFLSAGWGVSRSVANNFAISCSQGQGSTRAYFSAHSREWREPLQVISPAAGGQTNLVDFAPRMVKPGEIHFQKDYTKLCDEYAAGGEDLSSDEKALARLLNEFPEVELSPFPTWREAGLLKTFRSPGIRALDTDTLEKLKNWLDGKAERPPFWDARKFLFLANREKAFEAILDSFGEAGEACERAELALWNSLSGGATDAFNEILNKRCQPYAPNNYRALLFAKIQAGDAPESINLLTYAARFGEAENLPEYVQEALLKLLDKTIDAPEGESLVYHEKLINHEELPEFENLPKVYRDWFKINGEPLVKASAMERLHFDARLEERIRQLMPDNPVVQTICNLQRIGGNPTEEDDNLTFAAITAENYQWFVGFLRRLWQNGNKLRRKDLEPWLNLIKPLNSDVPLWNIYFGETVENAQLLYREVEKDLVPDSNEMEDSLASYVLAHWEAFSARVTDKYSAWRQFVNRFPLNFEKAFFPTQAVEIHNRPKVTRKMSEAADKFSVSVGFSDRIIAMWNADSPPGFSEIAPFLWKVLIGRGDFDNSGSIADLCRQMQNGRLPKPVLPGIDYIGELARFIHYAKADKHLKRNAEKWWERIQQDAAEAKRSGHYPLILAKQTIILLSLFPQIDFKPTATQLEFLVLYRQWLKEHLNKEGNHIKRRDRFDVAAKDFHSSNFDRKTWKEDYSGTILWAAFSGSSLERQNPGTLRKALEFYSYTNGRRSATEIGDQARMCLQYLKSYRDDFEEDAEIEDEALTKAVREGLLPLLMKKYGSQEMIKGLIEKANDQWCGNGGFFGLSETMISLGLKKEQIVRINPKPLEDFLKYILRTYGVKKLRRELDKYFDEKKRGRNSSAAR